MLSDKEQELITQEIALWAIHKYRPDLEDYLALSYESIQIVANRLRESLKPQLCNLPEDYEIVSNITRNGERSN